MTVIHDSQRNAAVDSTARGAVNTRGKFGKSLAALLTAGLALSLVGVSGMAASAGPGTGGSGGVAGGNSGNASALDVKSIFYDAWTSDSAASDQGSGQASINWMVDQAGLTGTYMQGVANTACTEAISDANGRAAAQGTSNPSSRVVGLVWAEQGGIYGGQAARGAQYFYDVLNEWRDGGYVGFYNLSRLGSTPWNTYNYGKDAVYEVTGDTDGGGYGGTTVQLICIALNNLEPGAPPNYDLDIETDATTTFATARGTTAVRDTIRADNNGSATTENVTASVILHWDGTGSTSLRSVTKTASIKNDGDTLSPTFTPGDFGWSSWPSGKFWFDVQVAKQGDMNAAVNTPDRDSRETWTAVEPPYVLDITTDAVGTFSTGKGTAAVSDTIHADSNGSYVSENVTASVILHWDGVDNNAQTVTKTVSIKNDGNTQSPNFTPADFGWSNWNAGRFWFDIQVAKQGYMSTSVNTDDRESRETWTAIPVNPLKKLMVSGTTTELTSSNQFASGQSFDARIIANANGYTSSMTIYDTIQTDQVFIGSATADVASKVSVLGPNGSVVSGATIKIDRTVSGKVTVSARIAGISAAFQGGDYTLVVPTFLRPTLVDYDIEDGSQACYADAAINTPTKCLNGNDKETTKVTPNPDKVWVLDEDGALIASDKNGTNAEGVDTKTFAPGHSISAVVNGSIPSGLTAALTTYVLTDDWTGASTYVDFSDASLARVFFGGEDVTSQFTIAVNGTVTTATAKAAFLSKTKGLVLAKTVKFYIQGEFKNDYDTDGQLMELTNAGAEQWNNEELDTNVPSIFTVTPSPDKVWVLDEAGALTSSDPDWSDTASADGKVFLMNDEVAAVVNGSVPANLGSNLLNYSISDDWTDAAQYVDFSDASKVSVFRDGVDVTGQFTISIDATVTTATATAAFLDTTANLPAASVIKLVISGAFRDDYDTDGAVVMLTNAGSETWNNRTQPTNTPPVFTWTPNPNKQVLGSNDQAGDKGYEDIDGFGVYPGQSLEYSIGIDLRIPSDTARGVKSLAVKDVYDPQFVPNRTSVEFWDSRNPLNPRPVARSAYTIAFDDATHSFTATFTQAWIDANVNVDGANSAWDTSGWLTMRFTGKVKATAELGTSVINQAFQIINGASTATEVPEVKIPSVTPDKEDLSTDLVDINGKTVVSGDHILYRLTLDAGAASEDLAYYVHKLGMVDDYDDEYLDLAVEDVRVTNQVTGEDFTSAFNIQIIDGALYVFAKQVDSVNPYGETILGDPQPEDLSLYNETAIDPVNSPIIDQSLLGHKYWITMDTVVKKVPGDHVIENQAVQNIENTYLTTRIVSNPLKDIDPTKDVVIWEQSGGDSINKTEVELNSMFNYRLNSSEIPGDRAYAAKNWSFSDTFKRTHDQFTGTWAIYADADLYDGETLIIKKGALLQDSASHESEALKGMFTVVFDEESYTLNVTANQFYLDFVNSRGDLPAAFSVYTQMVRIAPSDKVENQSQENYNSVDRDSNIVWTSTPENPAIEVVKYTLSEGMVAGDHNTETEAFGVSAKTVGLMAAEDADQDALAGVVVGFHVTNTGDVPLENVTISDETLKDTEGTVTQIVCTAPIAGPLAATKRNAAVTSAAEVSVYLAVGGTMDCVGTLHGLASGELHGDNVTVSGQSVFSGESVTDEDAWFAQASTAPIPDPEPAPPERIAVTGDPVGTEANLWLIGIGVVLMLLALAGSLTLERRARLEESQTLSGSNGSETGE